MPSPAEIWDWLGASPWAAPAAAAAVAALYLLLTWKPRHVREAERRARRLVEEGDRRYRQPRRPS